MQFGGATTNLNGGEQSENSAERGDLRPALIFLSGELMAAPIPLEREIVTLGRALEADIRLNDSQVSRLHAQIVAARGATGGEIDYRLNDLGSTNGTLLNGRKIVHETALQPGDKITVGDHILRFELLDEIDREFHRQIHRLLSHDELTGLLTSRSFFSELKREAARAAAESRPFCVLMIDLDDFKNVNDSFGHLTGSRALQEIGACIVESLRAGDAAARFGGDEFTAFLLDADLRHGLVAAERIRSAVEKSEFSIVRQIGDFETQTHRLTTSVGVASFPADSRDPLELVEQADTALYRAKQTGKNRVCSYRQLTAAEIAAPPARMKR